MLFSAQHLLCRIDYIVRLAAYAKTVSQAQINTIEKELRSGARNSVPSIKSRETGHLYAYGTLVSRPDPLSVIFGVGFTTYQSLQYEIEQLAADSKINVVYLHINSPGGMVEGVDDTWQAIRNLAQTKTVIAINEGDMSSGAYWLASAADKIYSTNETNEQGSIGVISGYIDWTKADEKAGIEEKIFTSKSAKYKHPKAEGAQPGYDEKLQQSLDDLEDIFISRISEGRDLTSDHIRAKFGEGSTLLGKEALAAAMIDGILPLASIYAEAERFNNGKDAVSSNAHGAHSNGDNKVVDKKELLENPLVIAEIDRLVAAAEAAGYERGRKDQRAVVEKAMVFITSEKYPSEVKSLAADVCKGERSLETLEAVVEVLDKRNAKNSINNKQKEIEENELDNTASRMPKVAEHKDRTVEDSVKKLKERG